MKSMTSLLKNIPSVLGLILVTFTSVFGQEVMKIKHSCNFDSEETASEHYTFEASSEATKIVNTLLQASGLTANSFILKEADCKNALATSEGNKRYILYNPVFLQKFKMDAKSKWVGYCVLAHEIAHHLNGHDLETTDPSIRKRQELEADKFAGHWLAKMGATLEEAQAGIVGLPLENESNTHPPKNARLVAVTNGWTKSRETAISTPTPVSVAPTTQPSTSAAISRPAKEITVPTGSLRCGECLGHGVIFGSKKCYGCLGIGRAGKRTTCADCNGIGKKEVVCTHNNTPNATLCTGCNLKGKKIVGCSICKSWGYTRNNGIMETCDICQGEKTIADDSKCRRCKGKGYVKN